MRFPTLGDKAHFVATNVKNAESSTTIPAGAPVILRMNGTDDGLAVILPTSSTALGIGAFQFGIATAPIAPGKIGETLLNGVYLTAIIVHANRAASTDSFQSYASQAVGAVLTLNTTANGLSVSAASTGAIGPGFILGASFASGASSASATSNTSLVVTSARKVFVRMM